MTRGISAPTLHQLTAVLAPSSSHCASLLDFRCARRSAGARSGRRNGRLCSGRTKEQRWRGRTAPGRAADRPRVAPPPFALRSPFDRRRPTIVAWSDRGSDRSAATHSFHPTGIFAASCSTRAGGVGVEGVGALPAPTSTTRPGRAGRVRDRRRRPRSGARPARVLEAPEHPGTPQPSASPANSGSAKCRSLRTRATTSRGGAAPGSPAAGAWPRRTRAGAGQRGACPRPGWWWRGRRARPAGPACCASGRRSLTPPWRCPASGRVKRRPPGRRGRREAGHDQDVAAGEGRSGDCVVPGRAMDGGVARGPGLDDVGRRRPEAGDGPAPTLEPRQHRFGLAVGFLRPIGIRQPAVLPFAR